MKNSLEIDEEDEELEDLDIDISLLSPQNHDVASGQRMPSGEDMWRSSRAAKRISKMKKFALGLTDIPMSGSQEGPVYEPGLKGPGESESSTFFGMEEDLDNNSENKPPINEKYQDNELEEDNMEDYLRDLEANLKTVGAIKAANRINKLIKSAFTPGFSQELRAEVGEPQAAIIDKARATLGGANTVKISAKNWAGWMLDKDSASIYDDITKIFLQQDFWLGLGGELDLDSKHANQMRSFFDSSRNQIINTESLVKLMSSLKGPGSYSNAGRTYVGFRATDAKEINNYVVIWNMITKWAKNAQAPNKKRQPGQQPTKTNTPESNNATNRRQTPVMILQEKLGVNADGIWGPITQGAWEAFVDTHWDKIAKSPVNRRFSETEKIGLKKEWQKYAGKVWFAPTMEGRIAFVDEYTKRAEEATTATTEPATTALTESAPPEEIASPGAEEEGLSEEDKKAQAIETVTKLFSDIDANALTIKKNLGINNLLARRRIRKLDGSGPAAEKVVERAWESMKGMKNFGQSNRRPGKEAALTELESFAIKVLRPTRRSDRRENRAARRSASDRSIRMNDRQIKIAKLMN